MMINNTPFPYERYETLAEPLTVYYPTGEETLARIKGPAARGAGAVPPDLVGLLLGRTVVAVVVGRVGQVGRRQLVEIRH